MNKKMILNISSWLMGLVVLILAVAVWASERLGQSAITAYDVFPLLGIGAFSLIWTHYALGSIRRLLELSYKDSSAYFRVSSVVIFFLLLLHPGILIGQLYIDGFGLPPQSYLSVYSGSKLVISLGVIALLIFLLFEFKNKFHNRRWWRYIEWAQVLAVILIFIHGLGLGRELSVAWFKLVWWLYGVSFIAAIVYNVWYDITTNKYRGTHE